MYCHCTNKSKNLNNYMILTFKTENKTKQNKTKQKKKTQQLFELQ